jgi:hypothetical protein
VFFPMCISMHSDLIQPFYYFLILPLHLLKTSTDFIILFAYMHMKYFDHIHHPSLSPFAFLLVPTPKYVSYFTFVSWVFLGLDSTYETEHAIFVFLSLAYFT